MDETTLERMNIPKRFWSLRWDDLSAMDKEMVERYIKGGFSQKQGKGLLLYGPEGHGKTSLAVMIAKILREKKYYCYFLPASDMTFHSMSQSFDKEATVKERVRSADLLIIDDLSPNTDKNILYSVLKYRSDNMLSTIVTLRVNLSELPSTETINSKGVKEKRGSFKEWFERDYFELVPALHGVTLPIPIIGTNYREMEQKKYVSLMTA